MSELAKVRSLQLNAFESKNEKHAIGVAGLLSFGLVHVIFGNGVQKPTQATRDEQAVRRLEDEWLGAYLRGDKATFDRLTSEDFTSTDESAKIRNKDQEREIIQAPPSSIKTSLTNEDLHVRLYGVTAIVNGLIVVKAQPGGQAEISFKSRFTDTLLKRRGKWQVVARHYSRLPPERTPVKLEPKVYNSYIGQYELAPGFFMSVTKEGDKLMTQGTGQPKLELLPESDISPSSSKTFPHCLFS